MNEQEKLIHRIEFKVVYFVLIIIFTLIAIFAYWLFVPVKVLRINQLPVPTTTPENIKSGRVIVLTFDYCKFVDVEGTVTPQLVSERLVLDMPPYQERLPRGCRKVEAPVILPYTVATQVFHIHYKITYKVNPLKEVVEEFDTADFEIFPIPVNELQNFQ